MSLPGSSLIGLTCKHFSGLCYLQRVSVFGCVVNVCSMFPFGCVVKLLKMFSLFAGVFLFACVLAMTNWLPSSKLK